MKHVCKFCGKDLYCTIFSTKIWCHSLKCLIKKILCCGCPNVAETATDKTNCGPCFDKWRKEVQVLIDQSKRRKKKWKLFGK